MKELEIPKHLNIVLELNNHAHVIPPWVKALDSMATVVYTSRQNLPGATNAMDSLGISAEVRHFPSYFFLKDILLIFLRIKKGKIVVTSTIESDMPLSWLFGCVVLCLIGVDVLCIRSARQWRLRNRISQAKNLLRSTLSIRTRVKRSSSTILTALVESLICQRSKRIVFESLNQQEIFRELNLCLRSNPSLIFPGRAPISDFLSIQKPTERIEHKTTHEKSNTVNIGVLGTLDHSRRDYKPLFESLSFLQGVGVNARVVFLGRIWSGESLGVLDDFSKYTLTSLHTPEGFVEEASLIQVHSTLDLLIAPLNPNWGYQYGHSTGSLADAVFLEKPLLIPSFLKGVIADASINYYEDYIDLASKIRSYEGLNRPKTQSYVNQLKEFLAIEE